jgi:hypothetical protein
MKTHIEQVAEEVVNKHLKWDQIEDRVMRLNGSFAMLPGQTVPGEKKKRGGAVDGSECAVGADGYGAHFGDAGED